MPSNFPFSAVLWDMDGTLIDSEPIWIEQERKLMRSLGAQWSDEDAIACIGGPMARVDAYMREKLPESLRSRYGPFDLTNQLLEFMERRLATEVSFTTGSFELLMEMKNSELPLGLVSASSRPLVDAALVNIGTDIFHVTVSDNDVQCSKPDPEGYLMAAHNLGVDITSCLIIEDSITGMSAAIASGAFVMGLPHATALPTGAKVVHSKSLEGVTMQQIVSLFSLVTGGSR